MVERLISASALIDGDEFDFRQGETLLRFVERHKGRGFIPTLCDAPQLKPYGACRVCCVEVAMSPAGPRRVVASCHTPVTGGMEVFTDSEKVRRLRRNLVELVLTDHPADCLTCEVNGNCELQAVAARVGVRATRYPPGRNHLARRKDASHPFITSDLAKCINCARCIRACDEIQGQFVLGMHGRGFNARIIMGRDQDFAHSPCVSCGACVQACPTSAISDVYGSKSIGATKHTRTICPYCGVGCDLVVSSKGAEVVSVQAAPDNPAGPAHACVKGRYAFGFYKHPDRLRSPMVRKKGVLREVGWDEAHERMVSGLRKIKAMHGPEAIAAVSSARCTNEENYLVQKFVRGIIGCNNIDCCARVCHSPSAYGLRMSFGTGAATNGFADIERTGCILLMGANPTESHPVTGARIKQRVMKGVPLIVVDPRRIELARYARHHLQLRPGTNVALLNMMSRLIFDAGLVDMEFVKGRCEGWEQYVKELAELDLERMEAITGVGREGVRAAALEYASANVAMSFHGLGVTEHEQGAKAVMAIANLAMMTGNVGKPGAGVNPLRGQNNVQGAADMGCQPGQGPGYLDVLNPETRRRFDEIYGIETAAGPGMRIPEMIEAAAERRLKALWLIGEDLVQSNPDSGLVKRAMSALELLVVQDLFLTETAKFADVILPASSFLEKSGTFTNTERRVQRVQAVIPPLPDTRPDGRILCEVMQRFGYPQPDFSAEGVLAEIARAVPFMSGVTWDGLGTGGKQWPVLQDGVDTPILHTERFARGAGRFHFFPWEESQELVNHQQRYPFVLTTGRLLQHYNCGTMTRRSGSNAMVDCDVLSIHPDDAALKCIHSGDRVRITSARGELTLNANLTTEVARGVLHTTFHFPDVLVNNLTGLGCDPETLCPEYKLSAVDIHRADWDAGRVVSV